MRILHWILRLFPYVRSLIEERDLWKKDTYDMQDKYDAQGRELSAAVHHCEQKQKAIELECGRNVTLKYENDLLKQRLDAADNLAEYNKEVISQISAELLEYRKRIIPAAPEPAKLPKPPAVMKSWRCSCPVVHPFHVVACSKCSRTRPAAISTSSQPSL